MLDPFDKKRPIPEQQREEKRLKDFDKAVKFKQAKEKGTTYGVDTDKIE